MKLRDSPTEDEEVIVPATETGETPIGPGNGDIVVGAGAGLHSWR